MTAYTRAWHACAMQCCYSDWAVTSDRDPIPWPQIANSDHEPSPWPQTVTPVRGAIPWSQTVTPVRDPIPWPNTLTPIPWPLTVTPWPWLLIVTPYRDYRAEMLAESGCLPLLATWLWPLPSDPCPLTLPSHLYPGLDEFKSERERLAHEHIRVVAVLERRL